MPTPIAAFAARLTEGPPTFRLAAAIRACGLLLLITAAAACSKKSPTAPSSSGLSGTWRATRAEFVDRANSNLRVEAIAKGVTIVLVLNTDNTFTMTTTEPGRTAETSSGTYSASTDVLTLRPSNVSGNTQFDMTLSGNTLTLSGGHVLFDVNGDDVDDESVLSMTLTRS